MVQSVLIERVRRRLQRPFNKRSPIARGMAEYFRSETMRLFAREEDSFGTPWRPLTAEYAARKQGPSILQETGRLYASMIDPRHREHIFRGRGRRLELGTKVPYSAAVYAERPYMPIDGEGYAEVLAYLLTTNRRTRGRVLPRGRDPKALARRNRFVEVRP